MSEAQETAVPLSRDGQPILFPQLPYRMHDRVRSFVQDQTIQRFVNKTTLLKDNARKKLAGELFGDDHPAWRELAGQIKAHTLDHLDHYVDRFVEQATAAGAQVHFASDAEEANAICRWIVESEGLRRCVKSKSMVTEETHLVPELEKAGVEAVETDLGEFILQLDHDAPSHIVTPMIHKDRVSVARAFARELNSDYTEDAGELTKIARRYLREKYQAADLGISGANFLVAETGSVVLCTNEGNGRFCTTAPRVHIALAGIEKLVPDTRHLTVLLKLLARTSTAQPLTVYTHILTGPRRPHEHDGPEQMHIILLDNGRTRILAQPEYRDALRCIRCGACLNACPVYRKVSGHSYGAVYSGPIGAVITPLLRGRENYPDLPHASSLCGACYEACPVKIDLPRMLVDLRRDLVERRPGNWRERLAYRLAASTLRHPRAYRVATRLSGVVLRRLAGTDGHIRHAPGPLRHWTDGRDLPAPPAESFRKWWERTRK